MVRSQPNPSPRPTVLIVDDEPNVRKFLRLALQAESYNVLEAGTAEEALHIVRGAKPTVMILDLGLPDLDGHNVIEEIRSFSNMIIIVLTGRREDEAKITALEHGADDYITKPFSLRDLTERLRSALTLSELAHLKSSDHLETGDLKIAFERREVRRGQEQVSLSDEEHQVLKLLALNAGRILTYGKIVKDLWGDQEGQNLNPLLQKRINSLRYKLEREPSLPRYIISEANIGYRLEIVPPASAQ